MIKKFKQPLYLIFVLALFSCKTQTKDEISISSSSTDSSVQISDTDGTTHNFGNVVQFDTLKTIFKFKNPLDTVLRIEKLIGSGRFKPHSNKTVLQPNEIATISINFYTLDLKGTQKRQITIKTDNEENPYYRYYIKANVQDIKTRNKSILFENIVKKKENLDNFSKQFDYSKNYSEKEIRGLNLDSTKISANEYYYLSNQKFLSTPISNISFKIYYKLLYGYQLEKFLRIEKEDTIYDQILAARGSNGLDGYTLSTEFKNDSIFIKTFVSTVTTMDKPYKMAFDIDSIITKYKYSLTFDFKEIDKDTFNIHKKVIIDKETGRKEKQLEYVDVRGPKFMVNGILCYWEYEVSQAKNEKQSKYNIRIHHQNLIKAKTKEILFSTDNTVDNYNLYNLEALIDYPELNLECTDINKDGYCDYQIVTERAAAGANTSYATYLFNPTTKEFEYSSIFSGANISYNSEKNRISSMWKMSVIEYYFQYLNLKPNKKEVEFVEKIHRYGDTISYKKIINDNVIAEKQVFIDRFDSYKHLLERN